jgi:hypothetical protein
MEDIIKDFESMINRHDDSVYATVNKLQYNPRTRSTILKCKEGRILIDNEEIGKKLEEIH